MDEKKHKGTEYYRSLKRKMVLLVIAVSFTPLILISSIMLYQFQESYHEKVLAHLEEVVLKHSQNINGFLDEKLAVIRVVAEWEDRVKTARALLGPKVGDVERIIRDQDAKAKKFMEHFYDTDRTDASLFHLVINLSKVSIGRAIDQVVTLISP